MTLFKNSWILFFWILISCQPGGKDINSETAPGTSIANAFEYDWPAIADKLMERMDVQSGERVMMVAKSGDFDPLISLLREKLLAVGAEDLGIFSVENNGPDSWKSEFVNGSDGMTREELSRYFEQIDLGIMMPGAVPTDLPYAAMQDVLNSNRGRTVHFHWTGAYDFNQNPLELTEEINAFYQAALLETDYQALKTAQQNFEAAMRNKIVRVSTPEGTDISFEIGDRPVTKQDGEATAQRMEMAKNLIDREIELPAGAIRVAPIETSVKGKIAFPDANWEGSLVKNLVLSFDNGKVVDIVAESGKEKVQELFAERGDVAQSFREFALGMNPKLAIPKSDRLWIPYYGYGAGVVRLSLGDNSELGGQVSGGYVRWNFFTNATVTVGDEIWVKDGILLK